MGNGKWEMGNVAVDFSNDFLDGQQDCANGEPHQAGRSDAYDRGYAAQYEAEQIQTEMEVRHGPK